MMLPTRRSQAVREPPQLSDSTELAECPTARQALARPNYYAIETSEPGDGTCGLCESIGTGRARQVVPCVLLILKTLKD
jgi:hypothetical protein